MVAEELYQEHEREMFGAHVIDNYTDQEIKRVLNRLLLCLPNEGKFYKYRPIEGKGYENAYDSLLNRYLWLSKAKDLNDDSDTVLYYDPEKSIEDVKTYIVDHPAALIQAMVRSPECKMPFGKNAFEEIAFAKVMDCFDGQTGEINEAKAITHLKVLGITHRKAIDYVGQVKRFVQTFIADKQESIEKLARLHLSYNEKIRDMSYIHSFSADYDCDQLWAYYANSNYGFCIEYDFQKAKTLPIEFKRKLISFYRVRYQEAQEFSFIPFLEWYLGGKEDQEAFREENYHTMVSLITKLPDWKHEKEWRLFLCDVENKLQVDLVSGLILDERILGHPNTCKLISLAKERGWRLTVRRKNITNTRHIYGDWSEGK